MNLKFSEDIGHIGEVLTEDEKKRGVLIQAFQMIQEEHNYLPEEALKLLSQKLDISLSDVYSTATFYKQFYFTPRGKKIVRVCTGTACHVRGADKVLDVIKDEFT
jgi:NADH:ubiquinone oxidoreductase subunit E